MSIFLLEKSLDLGVTVAATRDHNRDDLINLMESYKIIEIARDDFLNNEISFDEYLQLCELHQVNIDSYADTIEHNLRHLGLL